MRKSDLKGCTKSLVCHPQKQSIQNKHIKCNIYKTSESSLCRTCGTKNETISILSEFGKLAQKEYKWRHDTVGCHVHWDFSEKPGHTRKYKDIQDYVMKYKST